MTAAVRREGARPERLRIPRIGPALTARRPAPSRPSRSC